MRHFVHGSDGQKYGPADMALMRQWIQEGRLTESTLVEPEVGGIPFAAKNIPGLFPSSPTEASFAPYPYQNVNLGADYVKAGQFATAAWILAVIGLCLCWCLLNPVSIYCAVKARNFGHPNGRSLVIIMVIFGVFSAVVNIAAGLWVLQNGSGFPFQTLAN